MRWHSCMRRPRAAAHVGPGSSCAARTAAKRGQAAGRCHSLAMADVLVLQHCCAAAATSIVARACSGDRQRRWAAGCNRHRPGLSMRPQSDPLHCKRLYITDLAQRLAALERGHQPHPVAYRLFARRLLSALAGYPAALLLAQLGSRFPSVVHALSQRHFEAHGAFSGRAGARHGGAAVSQARLRVRPLTLRPPPRSAAGMAIASKARSRAASGAEAGGFARAPLRPWSGTRVPARPSLCRSRHKGTRRGTSGFTAAGHWPAVCACFSAQTQRLCKTNLGHAVAALL